MPLLIALWVLHTETLMSAKRDGFISQETARQSVFAPAMSVLVLIRLNVVIN